MQNGDENVSVVKATATQLGRGIESLKQALERVVLLSKKFVEIKPNAEDADLLRRIQKEAEDSCETVKQLSQATSLISRKLRHVEWPRGETWSPRDGERLIGQIVQIVDHFRAEFVLIQKDEGGLVTVFLSHADLKEKLNRLKPLLGKRVVIQRLSKKGTKYNYFVASIPHGSKVA